jgi:hypothetical protein
MFVQASAETRETTIAIVLHMADMMNQCDPLNIAEDWERRLSQEFYAQVRPREGEKGKRKQKQ